MGEKICLKTVSLKPRSTLHDISINALDEKKEKAGKNWFYYTFATVTIRAVGTGGAMAPPVFSEGPKRGIWLLYKLRKWEQISGTPCFGNLVTALTMFYFFLLSFLSQ